MLELEGSISTHTGKLSTYLEETTSLGAKSVQGHMHGKTRPDESKGAKHH